MRYLLILLLLGTLLLSTQFASAWGDGDYNLTLIGIVLDKNTKEPMQNAIVVLVEADNNQIYRTTTTQDGRFYFQLMKEKEYQIYATGKNGITGEVKTIQTYNKEKPEVLNVILTLEDNYLYEITKTPEFSGASYEYEMYRENVVAFKVQIGSFEHTPDDDWFTGIESTIEQEKAPSGHTRYLVGNYKSLPAARSMQQKMRNDGFTDSQIVTYLKGERVKMSPEEAARLYK